MKFGAVVISLVLMVGVALAGASVGTVSSSASGEQIIGAAISINGQEVTQTDISGSFVLPVVSATDIIRVRRDGYVGVSAVADAADATTLTFEVAPIWELTSVSQAYTDISDDVWFASAVKKLYEQQVLSVVAPRPYRPADSLTRAELVVLAVQAGGFLPPETQQTGFCDVAPDVWFAPAVAFLRDQSWIQGYDLPSSESTKDEVACEVDREFRPSGLVNRAEAIKIILSIFGDLADRQSSENICLPAGFSDVSRDAWFVGFVDQAYCLGLAQGYGDGTFRPAALVNRAEIAVILSNALEKLLQ